MLEQLLNHINQFALCKPTDKILLAVSGGLDSMVMLALMKAAGFQIAVAHCNFQLRGEESTGDEEHVRSACVQYDIPFHVTRFDTKKYGAEKSISVQMAARELRYRFFRNLIDEHQFDVLATAHHLNDSIETVFLNLVRGTGLRGLSGIPPKNENIIRPMLFASRKMLLDYAIQHQVRWREDSSNSSDAYQRNFFRHQITPRLEALNPSFEETFRDTQARISGAVDIYQDFLKKFRSQAVAHQGQTISIDIQKLRTSPAPSVILWELIRTMGFNFEQSRRIMEEHQSGKLFYSNSYQLLIDRDQYLINEKNPGSFSPISIRSGESMVGNTGYRLVIKEVPIQDFELIKESNLAQLDRDLLQFPLLWRAWQAGDYFTPLGMQQEKKLSDFLIDLKIPFNRKADVTVLESGGGIVWVVGFRISERFKVTANTKRVLILEQEALGE